MTNKLFYIALSFLLLSCDALLDIEPPRDDMGSPSVFNEDASAISAIRGIYAEMAAMPYFSNGGIALLTGLSGDELMPMAEDYSAFYRAGLKPEESLLKEYLWKPAYSMIYNANAAIDGLRHSTGVTTELRDQLLGEALFFRAFGHFYLTNLFGPVPLLTTKDVERNAQATRTARSVVYDTVAADLVKARSLLSKDQFAFTTAEPGRIRVTTWAASALLARVYLYQDKWAEAEKEVTRVIEREDLFLMESLDDVFKLSSRDAIWQVKSVTPDMGTWDAMLFMPMGDRLSVALCPGMLDVFESGDMRRRRWVDSLFVGDDLFYYPAKYKSQVSPLDEYHIELRLSEVHLIRAETRARLNDLLGAVADLDMIRHRAGLPQLAKDYNTAERIIDAIMQERRAELFTEGGHRWLDLIRLGRADTALGTLLDKDWQSTDILYPIPQSEIEANRNLLPQNFGY